MTDNLTAEIKRLCDETDIETNEPTQAWLVGNLRAALARHGETHTPTDDEREALRQEFEYRTRTAVAYGKGVQKWGQLTEKTQTEWIDEQVALAMNSRAVAGFRRSEVPEPSADGIGRRRVPSRWEETVQIIESVALPQGALPTHDAEMIADAILARSECLHWTPEPQAEPSSEVPEPVGPEEIHTGQPVCEWCESVGPEDERCPRHGLNYYGLWAEIDRLRAAVIYKAAWASIYNSPRLSGRTKRAMDSALRLAGGTR